MKIGILSMQRVVNYGSVLQAWSLREMVREATGTQAEFLEIEEAPALESLYRSPEPQEHGTPATLSRSLWQRGKRWCIARLSAWNKRLIRAFMRDELHLDRDIRAQGYDHVIIGSDEVFNHAAGVRLQLHGEVKSASRVISYAASCGGAKPEHIRPEDLPRVRQAMSRFSAISVRDEGTARYAGALWEGPLVHHMDPVLMGSLHARQAKKVWLKRYLLVYAYGHRIRTAEEIDAIRAFAKSRGLKTVAMGGSQFWCDLYIPAAPMRMLDWFAHAEYVVTDTFHGVIFSVINRRKFAAVIRPSNSNKMSSLLAELGLAARCVPDMSRLDKTLAAEIDYDAVDDILTRERQRARVYLKEQLTNEQGAHRTGS